MFSSLHFYLTIFSSLLPSFMTQTFACSNTTQTLCDGTYPYDNASHTQYECTTPIFSPVNLTSCDNGDPSMFLFWFWYDAVCQFNDTRYTAFAVVRPEGTHNCQNNSKSHVTYESCERDYSFSRQTITIHNISSTTQQKYICFLSISGAQMNYSSAKFYSVTALGKYLSYYFIEQDLAIYV